MKLYLDASALIKLMIEEDGTDDAREAWLRADRALSARIVRVEARSAITRRFKGSPPAGAGRDLESILAGVEAIEVDDALLARAETVAGELRLRALDAIHLAAAIQVEDDDLVVATWDRELASAANAVGLTVFP